MLNRFVLLRFMLCLFLGLAAGPVQAEEVCEATPETLTSLFEPSFGSYSIWDTALGEGPRQERFKSLVDLGDDTVFAAGEMVPLEGVGPIIMLAGFDRRGQVVWQKYHQVSAVREVVKVLKIGEGVVLAANRKHAGESKNIWLGFFDREGAFKGQKVVRDPARNLVAKDMALSADGKRILLSVTVEKQIGSADKPVLLRSPEVYVLDEAGKILFKRAYVMGANAEILGLSSGVFGDENKEAILATGYVENELGKKSGWVMRLGPDASLVWQQSYSRGLEAQIKRSAAFQKDYLLAFGDALPADGGTIGSWLMLLDASSGETLWQRFYNGAYHYFAVDLAVHPDHLISLMMQARVAEEKDPNAPKTPLMDTDGTLIGKMDYVQMLLLTPRGVTLSGESFFKGLGAEAYQLVLSGTNRYLVAGTAEVPFAEIYQKFTGMNEPEGVPASPVSDATMPEPAKLTKASLSQADLTVGALPEASVNTPGEQKASLPDAPVPQKSLSGLELLNQKVSESLDQKSMEKDGEGGGESDANNVQTTQDGWVFAGNGPEEYKDPCVKPEAVLP
ncbi:MAG: hypothetical protein KDI65_10910 [Alphaproteobacteria bacterium]|nr:hypothetical protein [Alphaproteobacteria bacterium]